MGRKKRKQIKPWCWYCNREFDDEKILVQHQKAKHFKCQFCHKKLDTGPGLSIHCTQVHREKVDKIPNSLPDRCNTVIAIYGMNGIPEADLVKHEAEKLGYEADDISDMKQPRLDLFPGAPPLPPPGFPSMSVPTLPFVPPPPMPLAAVPPPPPPVGPSVSFKPIKKIQRPPPSANGLPVELVHPDDDLPLEELRLMHSSKYKFLGDHVTTKNIHSSAVPQSSSYPSLPIPPPPVPSTSLNLPTRMPPNVPAGFPGMPMFAVGTPVVPGLPPTFNAWTGQGPPMPF